MSGALTLTFILGIAGVLWEWRQARQTARAEVAQRQRAEASEYAADMHLAQLALQDNNGELALSLLNRHRPQAKTETDLRGWEWRYLWQLCQGDELFTLHRYPRLVHTVALSRDGKTLAVATDSEVELWDLESRSPVPGFSFGTATTLAFSPSTNLLAVAAPNRDGPPGIQIWDLDTRKRLKTLARQAEIRSLSFSPDSRLLATFDGNGTVEIADWISGQVLTNLAVPVSRYTGTGVVAFSPEGSLLAIGEAHGQMRLLDLRTWSLNEPLPSEPGAGVSALAFSPNGDLLAAGYGHDQGTIRVWNTLSGQLRGQLTNHTSNISGLVFSPDGQRLFSASRDETIRVWDVAKLTEVGRLRSTGEGLLSLALLLDGKTLVTGGLIGSVCFWDPTMGNGGFVHTNLSVSSSFDSFAQLGAASFSPGKLDPRAVRRCGPSFLPDSRHFVALDHNGALQLWQTHRFQQAQDLPRFGTNHWSAVISPDGHWLATGDCAGTVTIWDWTTCRIAAQFDVPFEFFGLLRFSSSGQYLVARMVPSDWLGRGAQVRLWRVSDWGEAPLTGEQFATLWTVGLSPDDRTLAAGYGNGTIKLFGLPSRQWQMTLTNETGAVMAIHFTAAGRLLVSISLDGLTTIWDLASGRRVAAPLGGHRGSLFDAALSPDGPRLATGGGLGAEAVKLWDLTAQRQLISLEATGKYFFDLSFSADGNTLSATALSGEANLWHAPSWEEIAAAEAKQTH